MAPRKKYIQLSLQLCRWENSATSSIGLLQMRHRTSTEADVVVVRPECNSKCARRVSNYAMQPLQPQSKGSSYAAVPSE